jgi:branched-chain amino acid transport system substrate-binding protein
VESAGTFDTDKVRAQLQFFSKEPLLAGPTTYTEEQHINMQRDLIILRVDKGKHGNVEGVYAAEKLPD